MYSMRCPNHSTFQQVNIWCLKMDMSEWPRRGDAVKEKTVLAGGLTLTNEKMFPRVSVFLFPPFPAFFYSLSRSLDTLSCELAREILSGGNKKEPSGGSVLFFFPFFVTMTVARLVNLVAYAWLTGETGTHEKKGFLDDLPRGIFSPGYSEVNFFSAFPRTNHLPRRRFFSISFSTV